MAKNDELSIRHAEGVRSNHPVLAKLWYFWGNHFTISKTQRLHQYSTGAYQREFIRATWIKLLKQWFMKEQLLGQ